MKRNIYLMYAIALLQGMIFYGPVATLYRQVHGVSIFQITMIESISLILCILLELPWGIVADKIGYKKTLVFCCWIYLFSKIVFWLADGFIWFLTERIMLSFVLAGFSGVDTSILYLSDQKNSQKVFGIYASMQMAGLLFASCVFSVFIKSNYQLAGFFTVVSYGIAAVLSLYLTEVRKKPAEQIGIKNFKVTLKATLGNRNLLFFLLAVAFLSETHQTITVFLNQLQYEQCGLDNTVIGYIYVIATILGMAGRYSSSVTEKIGKKYTLILFSALAAVSCATLVVTRYALLSVSSILLLRISDTLFEPFQMQIQNRQIHTNDRATALSIHAIITDSIAIITNLIFGFLAERKLGLAFSFGTGICILSLLLFQIWYRKENKLTNAVTLREIASCNKKGN